MDFRVVVGLPSWEIGGVPTFAGNLVRGLRAQGVAAHILVSPRREGDGQPLAVPPDIVVETLPWSKEVPRRTRWQAMIQHLEGLAPCVYLPNHDFEYSCLSPKLSSRVAVIGHIHSDSDEQYEHFATLAKYSGLDLTIRARGDLRHHLMEDVAIAVGAGVAKVIPATAVRYGDRFVPMDDALVHAAIDVGGRPYYRGRLPNKLYEHWMRSFCDNAKVTLHLRILRGKHRHHIIEAAFKAVGLALHDALVDS